MKVAKALTLPSEHIVLADRAYVNFGWFNHLNSRGIQLVTRMKKGTCYTVPERRLVTSKRGITSDQIITLTWCLNQDLRVLQLNLFGCRPFPDLLARLVFKPACP